MKYLFILSSLIFLTESVAAQEKEHPIDVEMRKCIDSDGSTLGMTLCLDHAYDEWDKELNKYYKLLTGVLGADDKKELKVTQKNWLTYRDSEFALITSLYDKDGTMWRVVRADATVEIVKKRALELKSYYEMITIH